MNFGLLCRIVSPQQQSRNGNCITFCKSNTGFTKFTSKSLPRPLVSVFKNRTLIRHYTTGVERRIMNRLMSDKPFQKYADRPRGDLSEYNHRAHGLSHITGGANMAVLKAWERADFKTVIDICDDSIETFRAETSDWQGIDTTPLDTSTGGSSSNAPPVTNYDMKMGAKIKLTAFFRSMKAAALNQQQRYEDALKVCDKILEENSGDRDAWCLKGTALNGLGTKEKNINRDLEALECFKRVLALVKAGSRDLETELNLATILFKLDRHHECIEKCANVLSYTRVNEHELETSTDPFGDDGFFEEVAKSASMVPPNPTEYHQRNLDQNHIRYDPDIRILLASAYTVTKQLDLAIEQCQLGIKDLKRKGSLAPDLLARFYSLQLSCSVQLARHEEAELLARMLFKLRPGHIPDLEIFLGVAMELKKPYQDWIPIFDQFLRAARNEGPKIVAVLQIKLSVLQTFQRIDELVETCDEILKFGSNEHAYILKSLNLVRSKKASQALEVCEEAARQGIKGPEMKLHKAMALDESDFPEEALELYQKVNQDHADFIPAYFHRAASLQRKGMFDEAIEVYDQALEIQQDHKQVLLAKAEMLRGIGRLREATISYQRAAQKDPKLKESIDKLTQNFVATASYQFVSPERKAEIEAGLKAAEQFGASSIKDPGLFPIGVPKVL